MFESLAGFVARVGRVPRTVVTRVFALLFGATMFLVVIPWVLLSVANWFAWLRALWVPRAVELAVGVALMPAGLALCLWVTILFWLKGRGTPVPAAAPQELIADGPFRYCRNPIMLGALTFYLGLGSLAVSLQAGLAVVLVGCAAGTAYHRLVEEKELRLRFGDAYEDYRRNTPFLIPRLRRRSSSR
jgi:protein-S-isoprenylcysteine O-methyltransferase Ste14